MLEKVYVTITSRPNWALNAGGQEETTGLYKIEINTGPGSGVKILNKPAPPQFQEIMWYAE